MPRKTNDEPATEEVAPEPEGAVSAVPDGNDPPREDDSTGAVPA